MQNQNSIDLYNAENNIDSNSMQYFVYTKNKIVQKITVHCAENIVQYFN